jgi:glycerol-3-phosphate O-acyltransferase
VVARSLLRERTLAASRLLKLEFTYRVGASFESIFEATLARLIEARVLAPEVVGDGTPALRAASFGELQLLAGQVRDFVEAYLLTARALGEATAPLAARDLVKRVHDLGERLFLVGEVRRREACIDTNYQNAIAYFRERGVLVEADGKLQLQRGTDAKRLQAEIAQLLPQD